VERGFEGYVVKDESSRYTGGPTRSWLKGEADPMDHGGQSVDTTDFHVVQVVNVGLAEVLLIRRW
jgi:ATP-dependent DNA ligase